MKIGAPSMIDTLPEVPVERLPRVLLVEDDPQLRPALQRALASRFEVTAVASAEAAEGAVRVSRFDAILSDVHLGGVDGLEFLRRVHQIDGALPVLLMTGAPSLESAVRAVELGAIRYFLKPLRIEEVREALQAAVRKERSDGRRQEDAKLTAALRAMRMHYQPIVELARRRVVGYEALVRTAGRDPKALIDLATQLGREHELGRAVRQSVAANTETLPQGIDVYVNLQSIELCDEQLYAPDSPLSRLAPRVVLELTERAPLEAVPDLKDRLARLRKLGYRLAIDDLGAGYAGLTSVALVEPEVVKIDMSLIRDLHLNETKRRLVASLLTACRELEVQIVCEGVELPAERDALVELGCELFQGYLFARPAAGFPEPAW